MVNIEKIKTELGRKTIIKMPIRYAYYQPEYVPKEDEEHDEYPYKTLPPELVDLQTATVTEVPNLNKEIRHQVLCNTHFNSEDNPIKASYYSRMRIFKAIQYISVLEYKNTKNAVFTFLQSEVCFVKSKKRVFYQKPVTYQLTVRNDGKTTLTKNGKALLTNRQIERFFAMVVNMIVRKYLARHRGYAVLRRLFIKYFLQNKLPSDNVWGNRGFDNMTCRTLTKLYRVKQNPKLEDLPWDIYAMANIYDHSLSIPYHSNKTKANEGERSVSNAKVSLNRYLRRGDTKQAINACFYGFEYPKSINKVLFQTEPFEFPYASYRNISDLVERLGVNVARNLISNDDGTPNYNAIYNHHAIELLDLGFSVNAIKKSDLSEASDMLRIRKALLDQNHTLQFKAKVKDYHDYLLAIWVAERRAIRAAQDEQRMVAEIKRNETRKKLEKAYKDVNTYSEHYFFEVDDYVFRTPACTSELRDVADSLNICVSYDWYLQSFYLGHIDIVLITKRQDARNDKYIACLELRNSHLIQAKLNSNMKVMGDDEVFEATKKWAKVKNIILACEDVGTKYKSMRENKTNNKRLEGCGATLEDIISLGC